MTRVDQFESIFRAAVHETFLHEPPEIRSVLVLTDLDDAAARDFRAAVEGFLSVLDDVSIRELHGGDTVPGAVLDRVQAESPDLVCTYRNLHAPWSPYSLGQALEILTQASSHPVLVLPHPRAGEPGRIPEGTPRVMAMTDHLAGDHRIVNMAARLTQPGGTLFLTHIEDERGFDRIVDVISKIPNIDTDEAREEIARILLKEPRDYIESCRVVLAEAQIDITIEASITFGHRLSEYRKLIDEQEVDLLVLHTRDEDQLAMHGMVYPLAVELRQIPVLMT